MEFYRTVLETPLNNDQGIAVSLRDCLVRCREKNPFLEMKRILLDFAIMDSGLRIFQPNGGFGNSLDRQGVMGYKIPVRS